MGQPQDRERDHNAAQRAEVVYRLWLRGASWSAIARQCGYHDASGARKAWQRARKAMLAPPDLEAERDRERERLEIAYAGIAQRVEDGDTWSIDRAIAIAQRKAALLGLDASRTDGLSIAAGKRIILEVAPDLPALVPAAESEPSE